MSNHITTAMASCQKRRHSCVRCMGVCEKFEYFTSKSAWGFEILCMLLYLVDIFQLLNSTPAATFTQTYPPYLGANTIMNQILEMLYVEKLTGCKFFT